MIKIHHGVKRLGLIAGTGDLPKAIASEAKAKGYTVIAIALESLAERSLASYVDEIKWVNVGKLQKIIQTLKKYDIKEVVMAGKVSKALLYKGKIIPDLRALKLLLSLKDRSDNSILMAIAKEAEKEGLTLLTITSLTSRLLTPEGVLTKDSPTRNEWKDIAFGWKIAREIARLDIGQTVVVKNQAIMAVEAIEGTDEAIKRGGGLAGKGAVVVKVSRPSQDMRFDVPVVGMNTLTTMAEVHARVLALEVKKTIILDKEKVIEKAKEASIALVGYSGTKP